MAKKTKKQQALEFLKAHGWVEEPNSRTSKYLELSKPGISYHYYLGNYGAVRRGRTVSGSVSVKLKLDADPRDGSGVQGPQDDRENPEAEQRPDFTTIRNGGTETAGPDEGAEHRPDPTQPTTAEATAEPATVPLTTTDSAQSAAAGKSSLGRFMSQVQPAKPPGVSGELTPTFSGLAATLQASLDRQRQEDDAPHLIIEARAGTGKTTTLIGALQVLMGQQPTTVRHLPGGKREEVPITPSPQQQAVWDAVALSKGRARTVCFVAFNRSIAEELKGRVPKGCEAMTMHSMGFKAVTKALGRQEVNQWAVQDIIADTLRKDIRELKRTRLNLLKATEELVSLCKMNLTGDDGDQYVSELAQLAAHYDVDLNGDRAEVFDLVPKVLDRCKEPKGRINYDDMIWLPVVLNLPVFRYDLLLVDEAQDLNRCQQALAKRAGKRLVLCGDPKQAIYGFAGADAESMRRMEVELKSEGRGTSAGDRGCIVLPLTVTRRCGKAIVAEANKIVPDFEAHESNPEGRITDMLYPLDRDGKERQPVPAGVCQRCGKPAKEVHKDILDPYQDRWECKDCGGIGWDRASRPAIYTTEAKDGDMVLCRVNAPLVSQCFRFLKAGRKANIQGRDVGQGLISTVKKAKAGTVEALVAWLDDFCSKEVAKENAKRNPNEARLIALQDRRDCLMCFTEGASMVEDVIRKIESVFTDNKNSPGIRLSSIHKAKGLESRRVFLLQPKGGECPHPMARSAWQREQEMNLLYVAITRAIEELVHVS